MLDSKMELWIPKSKMDFIKKLSRDMVGKQTLCFANASCARLFGRLELCFPKPKMDFIISKVEMDRQRALQMVRVLGSLVVTKLLSDQREENED